MKFTADNQPSKRGRPVGSPNKLLSKFRADGKSLLDSLMKRALTGDDEATKMLLPFISKPKAYTEANTIDGEYLRLKSLEISEFEARILELESQTKK
jgi:hypothetical protein